MNLNDFQLDQAEQEGNSLQNHKHNASDHNHNDEDEDEDADGADLRAGFNTNSRENRSPLLQHACRGEVRSHAPFNSNLDLMRRAKTGGGSGVDGPDDTENLMQELCITDNDWNYGTMDSRTLDYQCDKFSDHLVESWP